MGESEKKNRLAELLNMEQLQNLQDNLSRALELAVVAVDFRGCPVTESSGFTFFCKTMRAHTTYGHLCNQCYAHGGLRATMTGKPCIYRCHCGLVEFAVPVMVDGTYLGIMGGQCELEGQSPDLEPILPQCTPWEEEPELARLRTCVHKTTYEKLEASAQLVQDILQNMLDQERSRTIQEKLRRKDQELMEEKAARLRLELSRKEDEDSGAVTEHIDKEHLFYILNVLSRLAFLEKAEETERTACDYAAKLRYALEGGEYNYVTLGEELEYIDYYLQIQKRRMEGRLRYEISVPERYCGALCPFMLLGPLVKRVMKYLLDNSRDGGDLILQGREEDGLLVLTICCEYTGIAGMQVSRMLDLEGKRQGGSLPRMDQSLKKVFGQNCGVIAQNREDGLPGMEIQVRLPLQGTITKE